MPDEVSPTSDLSSTRDQIELECPEKIHGEIAEAMDSERSFARHRSVSSVDRPDVWLHVYHCDPWTGYLNKVMLNGRDIPINHIGIEVYGEEWSFQYYEDCWDDPSVTGLIRCQPRKMPDYEYQDSICLGTSEKTEDEVDEILVKCQYDYSSNSYHLTKRNCMTFAYEFSQLLEPEKPFPERLKAILELANNSSGIESTINYGWSWAKWYMLRKHQQPEATGDAQSKYFCCSGGEDRQSSMWSLLLQPGHICGGKMSEGGRGKIDAEESFLRETGSGRVPGRALGDNVLEKPMV